MHSIAMVALLGLQCFVALFVFLDIVTVAMLIDLAVLTAWPADRPLERSQGSLA
jgi:hypothetical protein